jgi:hypothetical protein
MFPDKLDHKGKSLTVLQGGDPGYVIDIDQIPCKTLFKKNQGEELIPFLYPIICSSTMILKGSLPRFAESVFDKYEFYGFIQYRFSKRMATLPALISLSRCKT